MKIPKLVVRVLAAFVLLQAGSSKAVASVVQGPYVTPIGESEAFRANTGVAASGSSGAEFYNPGALTTVSGSKVSFSGAAYAFFDVKTDGFLQLAGKDLGYEAKGYQSIPFSVLSVVKDSDQFCYGFSVVQPGLLTFSNKSVWVDPSYKMSAVQDFQEADTWLGPTGSWKINDQLSLGATLYFVNSSFSLTGATNATISAAPNTIVAAASREETNTWGATLLLGGFYRLNPQWDLGLRVRTPSVQFSGKGSYYKITQTVVSGTLTEQEFENDSVDARDHFPLDVTVGAANRFDDKWTFMADLGFQTADNFDTSSDIQLKSTIDAQPALRLNLGAIYKINDKFTAHMGAFYNQRTERDLNGKADGTSSYDYYDASAGIMYVADKVSAGLGAFYLLGKGNIVEGAANGALKDITLQAYGAMLTSGYQF